MRKQRKEREKQGLRIDVKHNNVEWALKKMKRMIKDSGIIEELKKRTYYEKPSAVKREKKSAQAARHRYQAIKDGKDY